jgi:hypothetical protein
MAPMEIDNEFIQKRPRGRPPSYPCGALGCKRKLVLKDGAWKRHEGTCGLMDCMLVLCKSKLQNERKAYLESIEKAVNEGNKSGVLQNHYALLDAQYQLQEETALSEILNTRKKRQDLKNKTF